MKSSKVMVVTGGSRGIGAAISRLASQQDYRVCVNYRSDDRAADQLVTAIRKEGADAIAVQADVSRQDEVRKLFAAIDDHFGRLDVLVNNAGIVGGVRDASSVEAVDLEKIFATNVFSQFYCAAEAIRRMARSRCGAGGVIVNMSSVSARLGGLPREAHYAATKGATDSYRQSSRHVVDAFRSQRRRFALLLFAYCPGRRGKLRLRTIEDARDRRRKIRSDQIRALWRSVTQQ